MKRKKERSIVKLIAHIQEQETRGRSVGSLLLGRGAVRDDVLASLDLAAQQLQDLVLFGESGGRWGKIWSEDRR